MAGRASVEFYVGLALKARGAGKREGWSKEDAWVIRTFRNGLAVFVSRWVWLLFLFIQARMATATFASAVRPLDRRHWTTCWDQCGF